AHAKPLHHDRYHGGCDHPGHAADAALGLGARAAEQSGEGAAGARGTRGAGPRFPTRTASALPPPEAEPRARDAAGRTLCPAPAAPRRRSCRCGGGTRPAKAANKRRRTPVIASRKRSRRPPRTPSLRRAARKSRRRSTSRFASITLRAGKPSLKRQKKDMTFL